MPRRPVHVVVLAGGRGSRFWPWSRRARPKPFLILCGRRTLLEDAWRRARAIAPAANVWIVVPRELESGVRELLPRLRADRLVVEPSPRDTAPALGLACERIRRVDRRAVVLLMPSDHVIDRPVVWARDVRRALAIADRGRFAILGVPPRDPATGYGYVVCVRAPGAGVADVVRFVEKPDAATARRLLRTGRCLWNSGSFAAGADEFLAELARQRPGIARAVEAAAEGRNGPWLRLKPESVDYAVLEGARGLRAVALRAGWDDLGSWDVAARRAGPPAPRDAILIDAPGSAVFARNDRLIAVLGVPGIVVVDAPDALLVVARSKAQEVKRLVAALRRRGRKDLE